MKEYNRKTKRWEEKTTEQVGELKKKEMCRGGNAHKMVLVLPDYLGSYLTVTEIPQEDVVEFYASMDRIYEAIERESAIQVKLGLKKRWNHRETRHFRCEVCGKKDI